METAGEALIDAPPTEAASAENTPKEDTPLPEWMTLDGDSDTKTPVETTVTGSIPNWLEGDLYRNGAGIFSIGDTRFQHLFDGFAVLHRFIIKDGAVRYQSRILDSETWVNSVKANRLVTSQFATYAYPDPCKSMFSRVMSYLLPLSKDNMTDNTSVNIVPFGDKLYAMTETPIINEVDPDTLLKNGKVDLTNHLSVHTASAHPLFEPDGTMYNIGTSFNPAMAYNIVRVPAPQPGSDGSEAFKQASLLASVPSRFKLHISYNHSFGMSENFWVVLEQPITMNVAKVLTTNWRRQGFASNFVQCPDETLVFHVIRRSDGQKVPVTFQADCAFCFHFVNVHEDGEFLLVDVCAFDNISIIDDVYLDNIIDNDYRAKVPPATLRRYVIPCQVVEAEAEVNLVTLKGSTATAFMTSPGVVHLTPDYITQDKVNLELPRINDKFSGKKYRYAYGTSLFSHKEQLFKVDLEERQVKSWSEPGFSPAEPIFVPRPGATDEDDGVILSPILTRLPNFSSFLLILDAKTFTELGRATVPSDVKMAISFHGTFMGGNKSAEKS